MSLSLASSAAAAAAYPEPIPDYLFHKPVEPHTPFVSIVDEVVNKYKRYKIELKVAYRNSLMILEREGKTEFIIDSKISVNSSATRRMCNDNAGASNALTSTNIPAIHHQIFFKTNLMTNPKMGIWNEISLFAHQYGYNVVCQPNSRGSETDVTHTRTAHELQETVQKLFEKHPSISISPYHEIQQEFCLVIIDKKIELIFRKIRPHLIGDGSSTILKLYTEFADKNQISQKLSEALAELPAELKCDEIPEAGKMIYLAWKHNHGRGSTFEFLDPTLEFSETPSSKKRIVPDSASPERKGIVPGKKELTFTQNLIKLAKQAAEAFEATFASVDIALMKDGSFCVVKINDGIMLTHLIKERENEAFYRAKEIYEKAICYLMDVPFRQGSLLAGPSSSSPIFSPITSPQIPPKGLSVTRSSSPQELKRKSPSLGASSASEASGAFAAAASSEPIPDHLFHKLVKSNRAFVQIVNEVASKYSIIFLVASRNWIMRLELDRKYKLIHGHDLGLNSSPTSQLCDDKAFTSTCLAYRNVSCIQNRIFFKTTLESDSEDSESGVWNEIYLYARKYDYNVVCKPNSGYGGMDVIHTKTAHELQEVVQKLFEKYPSISISRYHAIQDEFRLVMRRNKAELIFKKIRPHLTGDGSSTILKLYTDFAKKNPASKKLSEVLAELPAELKYDQIPEVGKIIYLAWKHNLCGGATSEFLDHTVDSSSKKLDFDSKKEASSSEDYTILSSQQEKALKKTEVPLTNSLIELAKQATMAVKAVFVSVDIGLMVDGSLSVVEINNGVSLEHLIKQHKIEGYHKAKEVYEKAICQRMNIRFREHNQPPRLSRSSPMSSSPLPLHIAPREFSLGESHFTQGLRKKTSSTASSSLSEPTSSRSFWQTEPTPRHPTTP